jgi:hypothetical protein
VVLFHFSVEKVPVRVSPDKRQLAQYTEMVSAAEIIEQLPKLTEAERGAVLNKLRELLQVDDDRWEQLLNDPQPRPKLESFVRESPMKEKPLSTASNCEVESKIGYQLQSTW